MAARCCTDKCCCGESPVLIYACAGGSNVGQLSNEIAKYLTEQKAGKMTCTAALGADLHGFILSARSAKENILLDGCPVKCIQKTFKRLGIPNYKQYILTEMGITKEHNFICKQKDIEKIANIIMNDL